jgi:hypothetical protein
MNFCFFIGILDINEEKYGYQASKQGEITMFYPSLAPKMSSSLSNNSAARLKSLSKLSFHDLAS